MIDWHCRLSQSGVATGGWGKSAILAFIKETEGPSSLYHTIPSCIIFYLYSRSKLSDFPVSPFISDVHPNLSKCCHGYDNDNKDSNWNFPPDIEFPVDARVIVKFYKVVGTDDDD